VTKDWIDEVKFNADGLVPVVAQDFQSGRVLMLAWANAEALREACDRSRRVLLTLARQTLA
jgi:phosphoribosyl-AMP cyclohydrolase